MRKAYLESIGDLRKLISLGSDPLSLHEERESTPSLLLVLDADLTRH